MKKIIYVSILAIFILLTSQSISAVEYNFVSDENGIKAIQKIKDIEMGVNDLKEQLKNIDKVKLNEKINVKEFKEKIEKTDLINLLNELKYKNQPAEPKCIITLILIKIILKLTSTILNLGVNILLLIIDTMVVLIKLIIFVPYTIVQTIISMVIYIIDMILNTIFAIITP